MINLFIAGMGAHKKRQGANTAHYEHEFIIGPKIVEFFVQKNSKKFTHLTKAEAERSEIIINTMTTPPRLRYSSQPTLEYPTGQASH